MTLENEMTAESGIKNKSKVRSIGRNVTRDLAEIALFVALMVAGTYLSIPFPLMPLTFQTVFCVLSGLLLGPKKGTISMAVYAFMGLVGLPVFTGGGGIFYVLKPSFGYILGFVVGAFLAGLLRGKQTASFKRYLLASMAGLVADYVVGILYFIGIYASSTTTGLGAAIVTYNLVYIPKDIALCVLAAMLAQRLGKALGRGRS